MGTLGEESVSPELVLVDPELARRLRPIASKGGSAPVGVGRRADPGAGGRSSPAGRDQRPCRHGKASPPRSATGSAWRRHRGGCSVLGVCRRSPVPRRGRRDSRMGAGAGTRRRAGWSRRCRSPRLRPRRVLDGAWPVVQGFPQRHVQQPGKLLCREASVHSARQSKQRSELGADPLRDLLQRRFHPSEARGRWRPGRGEPTCRLRHFGAGMAEACVPASTAGPCARATATPASGRFLGGKLTSYGPVVSRGVLVVPRGH